MECKLLYYKIRHDCNLFDGKREIIKNIYYVNNHTRN